MTRIESTGRLGRLLLTAGIATAAAVTGLAGTAQAGTPLALPTGTVLDAAAAGTIANSYIVVLKPGSAAAANVTSSAQLLAKRYGGTVRNNYLATVRGFNAVMSAPQAARLAADPSVEFVEQDAKASTEAAAAPSSQPNPTWGLDRIDQHALPLSRSYGYHSAAGVTAYVLDTGMRISHNQFGGRARNGWDFIDRDAVANDCNGHGTHVAGTIGGSTYGVAKDVKLVAVRVLDCDASGSYSAIIAGIDWVTANAVRPAVANMSIGGPVSKALDAAVARAIAKGITFVVAAGNDNISACKQSPAELSAAITVAATGANDKRASYSNYGKCVDIFAPGSDITSAYNTSDSATTTMDGTSMASPHVAGAAAMVLAAHPGFKPTQVSSALLSAATSGVVKSAGAGSPNKMLYAG
jgi:subtilisin family serine protease